MPKPRAERYGLEDMMRDAKRAAEAYNRDRACTQPHSRNRGAR